MAVKRRNKSVYISVYSYTIPAFWLKNPVFPGVFVSMIITQICKRLSLNTIIRDKIGGTYFGKILTRRYKY